MAIANCLNRPWLAYSQPLAAQGRPWDPKAKGESPHVDGVLHLRNALEGRYGYLCLWYPADAATATTVSFRPADYQVKLSSGMEIVRLKDGITVPHTVQNGQVNSRRPAHGSALLGDLPRYGSPVAAARNEYD